MEKTGKIIKISGPLVVAEGVPGVKMFEVVKVSERRLIGEVINIKEDKAFIQVYEDTSGISCGEPVFPTGELLSVELGPGLLNSIYDGIQRPLNLIAQKTGAFIERGVEVPALDREKKWHFKPFLAPGEKIEKGDILGEVKEGDFSHKILVPPFLEKGILKEIKEEGEYSIEEEICKVETEKGVTSLKMYHKWPVRRKRPVKKEIVPDEILVTGQRVIDSLFPLVKGGTACIPGPFGAGKTVLQHQLAKWTDADIIIFIGCGERGNEMADVLIEFSKLKDPRTKRFLLERSVLIANTSNMPVAAREASIYTGITIAEYFRDMGYDVALMADSTSRWAEALREISGRMEEMPGEEGYPSYLASRTSAFYERAGKMVCLGRDERKGSVSVIGAVSPPGGDFSEPVTQSTLRVTKVFWGLDDSLANRRHFPAINWLNSYSLYRLRVGEILAKKINPEFPELINLAQKTLQEEAKLQEIVSLVGKEGLSEKDKLLLEIAKSIREDFLIQNAFDEIDTFSSLQKQYLILKTIFTFEKKAKELIEGGKKLEEIDKEGKIKEKIGRLKYIPEEKLKEIEEVIKEIEETL